MAQLDTTAIASVLKVQYTQKKVNLLAYNNNPFWASLPKRKDFYGSFQQVAIRIGSPQGRGYSVAQAQANETPSVYKNWNIQRVKDYTLAQLTGEAIEAASNDEGALLRSLKTEIDGAMYTETRNIALTLFRNGGGQRGQIASGQGTTQITLVNASDVTNFEVGMIVQCSANDGTSGSARTGTVTLTAIDRDQGLLTASTVWSTGITGCAALDYIFQQGDCNPSLYSFQTGTQIKGLAGWLPTVAPAPGDNFFGLDRSVDPTRLAGVRYSGGSGGPIEESLIEGATRIGREGGKPDKCFVHPFDWSAMVKSIGTKVMYDRSKSVDEPEIGFRNVKLMGPSGDIEIMPDLNCPRGLAYMLTMSDWYLYTMKDAPRILNLDGLEMLRNATADSYEFRIGMYGNLVCEAPGHSGVIVL